MVKTFMFGTFLHTGVILAIFKLPEKIDVLKNRLHILHRRSAIGSLTYFKIFKGYIRYLNRGTTSPTYN